MKIKVALLASYATQAYISLISIILMPVYLHYLGAESFGLIGFYIMLQGWMQILDMGLTPVLAREMSRFCAGTLAGGEATTRLHTLEVLQGALALIAVGLLWAGSDWLGETWLSASSLSGKTLAKCINLIGVAVAFRWLASLHRAALAGLERQDWVNGLSAGFATLRFAGVLPLLIYVSTAPEHFFMFQAGAGALELASFRWITHRLVPGCSGTRPNRHALKAMLPMVGSMAFLSAMWVMVTQVDKLILSGLLPLKEYGNFTLAVTAASGVMVIVPPLNQVVQPRMTILSERGEEDALREFYRLASQLAAIAFVGLGGGLAFFAEPILHIWSGSNEVAQAVAPVLFWYSLANAVVGILVLPFILQFAKGQLSLHVLGNLITLFTLVPALIFAARQWGAIGAGQVLFAVNLLFLMFWVPLVHRRFMAKLTWKWSLRDTLPLIVVMGGVLAMSSQALPRSLGAYETLAWIGVSIAGAVALGIIMCNHSRQFVRCLFFGKE